MASIQKRIASDGGLTYRVQVRIKGHPVERATFRRLTKPKKLFSFLAKLYSLGTILLSESKFVIAMMLGLKNHENFSC